MSTTAGDFTNDYFTIIPPNVENPWPPYRPFEPWTPLPDPYVWPPLPPTTKIEIVPERAKIIRRRKTMRERAKIIRPPVLERKSRKKKQTFITLVLDKSTSMTGCKGAALSALNEQIDCIKENASKGGDTFVNIVFFGSEIEIVRENILAKNLRHVTTDEYILGGATALRDAMLTSIELMEGWKNPKKNQGYLVVLISDGQENVSGTTAEELKRRVDALEESGEWTITYMLDGHSWQDIQDMSLSGYGASMQNYASFNSNHIGTLSAGNVVRSATSAYLGDRSKGVTAKSNFYTDPNVDQSGVETTSNQS